MLRGQSALDLTTLVPPVVICGPSGVGKGTIIEALMGRNPDTFAFCVSHTTRAPRPGEEDGRHYHFTEMAAMRAAVDKGAFLEYAHVHGNMYGTSLAAVNAVSSEGRVAILDIDVQGTEQVRASCLGPRCLCIFVAPPSHAELERRLRGRGTETEDKVLKRLANASSEIEKSKAPGLFNVVVVNDHLETAVLEVSAVIEAHRRGTIPGAPEALAQHLAARAAAAAQQQQREAEEAQQQQQRQQQQEGQQQEAREPAAAAPEPAAAQQQQQLAAGAGGAAGAGAAAV
ncbi:MAG: P-loop containing nucleoside triphosphate hydrolase protein [Monoraphidium minutum]|nr:MAG: P-loop containing nucleoside triphosphate hydrolase protein [Monoraphidium minutum]